MHVLNDSGILLPLHLLRSFCAFQALRVCGRLGKACSRVGAGFPCVHEQLRTAAAAVGGGGGGGGGGGLFLQLDLTHHHHSQHYCSS